MADCGSIMAHVKTLQARIQDDKDQLNDPNLCDNISKQECIKLRERLLDDEQAAQTELDQVLPQVTSICSLLVGTWQVDANGSDGQLSIEDVDSITGQSLSGHIFGSDPIAGSWDDTAKVIQFRRTSSDPNFPQFFQDYTGFLGDNNAIILAGEFTQFDTPPGPGRFRFGWFARK